MTLRTLQIPDPAQGVDWSTVVPGNYLYDITGITAELKTFSAQVPVVMSDISGNGNNGVYGNGTQNGLTFVAGLVPGDQAIREVGPQLIGDAQPLSSDPLTGDFTLGVWVESSNPSAFFNCPIFQGSHNPTVRFQARGNSFGGFFQLTRFYNGAANDFFTTGTMPVPAGPNFIVAVYTAATNHVVFYLNGVAFPAQTYPAHPMVNTTNRVTFGAIALGDTQVWDEVTIFDSALSGADVAALYAAGRSSWDVWSTEVFARNPFAFYPLDDLTPDNGRAVVLTVTDGTHELEAIAPGVPVATFLEPFFYAWQPGLGSSSSSPRPSSITVATPRLLLPPGYTVGVRTLDLSAVDQWENITLWWDDSVQRAVSGVNDWDYPPGVKLVLVPTGG